MIDLSFVLQHRWFSLLQNHRCVVFSRFGKGIQFSLFKLFSKASCIVALLLCLGGKSLPLQAQSSKSSQSSPSTPLSRVLPQQALQQWHIPAGNYSGITPLGQHYYAVVSDKTPGLGYFVWHIQQDSLTGQVQRVTNCGFRPLLPPASLSHSSTSSSVSTASTDVEDVVFDAARGVLWVADEGAQTLTAYDTLTQQNINVLAIPSYFSKDSIYENLGFEALTHHPRVQIWCSTSESPLRCDAVQRPENLPSTAPLNLRLTFWDTTYKPIGFLPYQMAAAQLSQQARYYLHGIPALCLLPNGALLVMERELSVPRFFVGAKCSIRLRLVPQTELSRIYAAANVFSNAQSLRHTPLASSNLLAGGVENLGRNLTPVSAPEVASWHTRLDVFHRNLANYEGCCLGRQLSDGRQTILCISDAQGGAGRWGVHLRDYIRVVVLDATLTH